MQVTFVSQRRLRPAVSGLFLVFLVQFALLATRADLPQRQANSTLKMPLDPHVDRPDYQLVEALNGMTFEKPVFVANPPGDLNWLFVVERPGQIVVVTNLDNPTRTVFLDISSQVAADWETDKLEGLTSIAFHPDYPNQRFPFFFVTYTMRRDLGYGPTNFNRLARFQSSRAFPNEANPESELPLITQEDHGDGHNFNNVTFGSDGYLYMSVGDEGDGGKGDDFNNAQRIDKNFFSAILRIDVDKRPDNLPPNPHPASTSNYSVPADNPWVGATSFNGKPVDPSQVRTEFYAVGLRNPWRISFDPETGFLYEGDVGQHTREEINVIVKGGNYGWSFLEGTVNGPKGPPPAGLSFLDPIHQYSPGYGPDQGFCVTGGMVYRGPSLPELTGAYIFADYVSGNIWSLRYDGNAVSSFQRLASHTGIVGFGIDPRNRELLLIDHDRGKIYRLEHAADSGSEDIPPTLSQTGAFADLSALTPNPGILPYGVNQPFWSDGALKQRWFSVPDPNKTIAFKADGNWTFPTGTVWIKHFELDNVSPGGRRRIETRLLVKTDQGVYGATYRWGDSTSDAQLVPEEGMDEPIQINDNGTIRTQVWHYPSRNECLACHTPAAGYALGFTTAQLNRDIVLGGSPTNQLGALAAVGYFNTTVSNLNVLPALASLSDSSVSREYRVRSYLDANCASCHQPGGPAHAQWDARLTTPLASAGILGGSLFENGGDSANHVVTPGSLEHSMLFSRISQLGPQHMPPIGTTVLNTNAINLLQDWILNDLPARPTFADWQQKIFGQTLTPDAAPEADPDHDGASNYLEFLTGGNPLDPTDAWKIGIQRTDAALELVFPKAANRIYEVQFTDDLTPPFSWQPLNVPGNQPLPWPDNGTATVRDDTIGTSPRLYRISVREP